MGNLFAIGDLHLSFSVDKPMDVFGPAWANHTARLERSWRSLVRDGDLVLVPGDISWAIRLEDAKPDLDFIGSLPGEKLLLRGNHDYWWGSVSKVRSMLSPGTYVLQNDAFHFQGLAVCGSRGWVCPGSRSFTEKDDVIYQREAQRLSLSLEAAPENAERLVMMHFPPFNESLQDSLFTRTLEESGVKICLYAHLHGAAACQAFNGSRNGVLYRCVSSDALGFSPERIL